MTCTFPNMKFITTPSSSFFEFSLLSLNARIWKMSLMLEAKRSTRGLRMDDLVGEAADEDDAFWGHDTWVDGDEEEDSGAESFSEEEAKPDVFDDDFNDTESSSDEDDDEEEKKQVKQDKQKQTKDSTAKNRFKEPGEYVRPKKKTPKPPRIDTEGGMDAGTPVGGVSSSHQTPAMKRRRSVDSLGSGGSGGKYGIVYSVHVN